MGADLQFQEFVKRQQRSAAADAEQDWNKERDDWLARLDVLYANIAGFLKAYVDTGAIELRESSVELNEENIGAYRATRLSIVIGAQEITLTPVGTLLIGSKGRVDVEGSAGTSRLLLIDKMASDLRSMLNTPVRILKAGESRQKSGRPARKKIEWVWTIVSRPASMQFADLNKDSFFEMLMEVSNG